MDPSGYPAGYPVPTQSPQQTAFYPNAAPYQSKTQHSFAMPMQPGAMMPSGFPQSSAAPMENFSAPFNQTPIPTTMSQFVPPQGTSGQNMPSQVAQTFSQNMASISANNLLGTAPKPPSQMNSPQSGASPAAPQAQAQAQAQAQFAAREKARVTALLDINSALLQEVVNLQAAGKAGAASNPDPNSPTTEQAVDPSKAGQKPSPEYIECMRRLQANLAYLATIADRAKKPGGVAPQAPAIMTPPPNLPSVNDLYTRLNELFSRTGKAPTPQRLSPQGNGGPSPGALGESVV